MLFMPTAVVMQRLRGWPRKVVLSKSIDVESPSGSKTNMLRPMEGSTSFGFTPMTPLK